MSLCPHGYTAFWDCPTCEEPMGTRTETVIRDCEYHGATAHIPDPDDEALVICQACEVERAERMADARRSWKPEVQEPEEGEVGYRCPSCGELYDSKCRTPADAVCFQCRYPEDR